MVLFSMPACSICPAYSPEGCMWEIIMGLKPEGSPVRECPDDGTPDWCHAAGRLPAIAQAVQALVIARDLLQGAKDEAGNGEYDKETVEATIKDLDIDLATVKTGITVLLENFNLEIKEQGDDSGNQG